MKALVILGWAPLFLAASAAAQFGGSGSLGGPYASRGMSRPLGGVAPPLSGTHNRGNRGYRENPRYDQRGTVLPYASAIYVPGYFDSFDNYYGGPAYAPPAVAMQPPIAAPAAPPVIINQYFASPPQLPEPEPQAAPAAPEPGAPLVSPSTFYLIAYKDHSVYSALAYWVEDKTLHYVTTNNTHNQISLDLVDLPLTRKLNEDQRVPFSIPAN